MARRRKTKWKLLLALLCLLLLMMLLRAPAISFALAVLFGIGIIGYGFYYHHRIRQILAVKDLNKLTHRQFEEFWDKFFEQRGYDTELTPATRDQGADVIIEKNGVRTAIQTKQYTVPVGNEAVQQVVAAKAYYNCQKATVITTSVYTPAAKALAEANGVELWDGKRVMAEIAELPAILQRMGLASTILQATPRWGFIVMGILLFLSATVFSYNLFGDKSITPAPSASSPVKVNSNIPQQNQSPSTQPASVTQTQAAPSQQALPQDNTEQRRQAISNINDQISQVNVAITQINNEINYSKSQIQYQQSQIRYYEQTRAFHIKNGNKDAASEFTKMIVEANNEIARLQSVIAADQSKLADLTARRQSLLQQRQQLQNQ